jgi:hypothetical protein
MQAKTDGECKEIHMGHITMKSDIDNSDATGSKLCISISMPRSETTVQLLTTTTTTTELKAEILGKMEVAPGVYMAEF